jgi:hypothetical protein
MNTITIIGLVTLIMVLYANYYFEHHKITKEKK